MMRVIRLRRRKARRRLRRRRKILRVFSQREGRGGGSSACAITPKVVLGAFGVPLPRLPDADIERMADEFLSVWRN